MLWVWLNAHGLIVCWQGQLQLTIDNGDIPGLAAGLSDRPVWLISQVVDMHTGHRTLKVLVHGLDRQL